LDRVSWSFWIKQRIKEIGVSTIKTALKLPETSSEKDVIDFVINLMGNTIGGYSLHLVSGRFRAGSLSTKSEIASRPFSKGPYLVDETTAVVRFILPVTTSEEPPSQMSLFEPAKEVASAEELVEQMRWLFLNFSAEAVTRVVKKEDEIWLLESGMRSALYRWVRKPE